MAKNILLKNISEVLTLEGAAKKQGRRVQESDLGIQQNISIVAQDGRIVWIGPHKKLPKNFATKKIKEYEMKDRTVLPGFVECHTHTVFAGNRAEEFEMRNQGATYQEISAKGGGIVSTMRKTRSLSLPQLVRDTQARADRFLRQGVTTLEIKSGYGLDLASEIKMLQAAGKVEGLRIVRTFLGAHGVPPEFQNATEYVDYLIAKVLPEIRKKKLAERVDIFIENGFFSKDLGEKYLREAKRLGFDIVIHADQLTLSGGGELAVQMQALSGDHLIQLQEPQIQKLAASEVSCVLLPSADLYMRCAYPPARKLIDAGARVALATDFNPGTAPSQDLALVGLLARLEMKMTLPEVIAAYTVGAAHALKLSSEVGSLVLGKSADFVSIDKNWRELFYSVGDLGVETVFSQGDAVHCKI